MLLTFDDGTVDALELLAPLLRELKAPAALFAIPGSAGQVRAEGPHSWTPPGCGRRPRRWRSACTGTTTAP